MSIMPRTGVCMSCGYDHGNGMGLPRLPWSAWIAAPLPAAPAPTEQAEPSVAEVRKCMNSLKLRIAELEDDLIVTEQSNERLRAALAARQAPTEAKREPLSEAQLDQIARAYFAEPYAQENAKNAIHDAFLEARQAPDSERDAARYRWLRNKAHPSMPQPRSLAWVTDHGGMLIEEEELDLIIDAAIAQEKAK